MLSAGHWGISESEACDSCSVIKIFWVGMRPLLVRACLRLPNVQFEQSTMQHIYPLLISPDQKRTGFPDHSTIVKGYGPPGVLRGNVGARPIPGLAPSANNHSFSRFTQYPVQNPLANKFHALWQFLPYQFSKSSSAAL